MDFTKEYNYRYTHADGELADNLLWEVSKKGRTSRREL